MIYPFKIQLMLPKYIILSQFRYLPVFIVILHMVLVYSILIQNSYAQSKEIQSNNAPLENKSQSTMLQFSEQYVLPQQVIWFNKNSPSNKQDFLVKTPHQNKHHYGKILIIPNVSEALNTQRFIGKLNQHLSLSGWDVYILHTETFLLLKDNKLTTHESTPKNTSETQNNTQEKTSSLDDKVSPSIIQAIVHITQENTKPTFVLTKEYSSQSLLNTYEKIVLPLSGILYLWPKVNHLPQSYQASLLKKKTPHFILYKEPDGAMFNMWLAEEKKRRNLSPSVVLLPNHSNQSDSNPFLLYRLDGWMKKHLPSRHKK